MSLFVTIVLDGVGIGAQPDAARYGDEASNTLAHVCATARPELPHLAKLGLGCIAPLEGVPGIGPGRRKALLSHFGGLKGVRAAGVEELTRVRGISRKLAEEIVRHMRDAS